MSTMKHSDIDQITQSLSVALKTLEDKARTGENIDLTEKQISKIIRKIPYNGLTGDQISGGRISNFSSTGISDDANNTILTVTNEGIVTHNASINTIKGNINVEEQLTAGSAVIVGDLTVSGVLRANVDVDTKKFLRTLPDRSISGNKINGGLIRNFNTPGIKDESNSTTKLMVTDDVVSIDNLSVENIKGDVVVEQKLTAHDVHVEGEITATRIRTDELFADIRIERTSPLEFTQSAGNPIIGKGLLWTGAGVTRQFILRDNDQLFSTENINLNKGRSYQIDNIPVLNFDSLGSTITRSRLREVGNLQKLTVLGNLNLDNQLFFFNESGRLSFGHEEPNGKFSIYDKEVEFKIDTKDNGSIIGTHGYNSLSIITDNTERLSVGANGHITLGHKNSPPTQVSVHGRVSIGVSNPDQNVDLHVNGPVRFNDKLQSHGTSAPRTGSFNRGDIFWNTEPRTGQPIGWVCIVQGTPGEWRPFGIIG